MNQKTPPISACIGAAVDEGEVRDWQFQPPVARQLGEELVEGNAWHKLRVSPLPLYLDGTSRSLL